MHYMFYTMRSPKGDPFFMHLPLLMLICNKNDCIMGVMNGEEAGLRIRSKLGEGRESKNR